MWGVPCCLITLLQEQGRDTRVSRMVGMFAIFTDWKLFVKLLLFILFPPTNTASNKITDHECVNLAIASQTPERHRVAASSWMEVNVEKCPLTNSQKQDNIVVAYNNLIDTMNFLFIPNWGCVHLQAEWYLHSKSNTRTPTSFTEEHGDSRAFRANCAAGEGPLGGNYVRPKDRVPLCHS